jgi:hypothetical protein
VAVAVALLAAACGSSSTPSAGPTTSDTASPCPSFGATADASGEAAVTADPAVALLRNVQVQASACVDEVAFSFFGGLPGWSVGYADEPLTEDPSGRPVSVAGDGALVVRFEPASGVDQSQDQPTETYDGPTAMTPPGPSDVREVRRLGDFEAVTSWVLGVDGKRPFEVVARGDEQLVVRLPATTPRVTRCTSTDADVTIGYPADWYAELSDRWACRYFDPAPFVVHPATNDFRWAVTVQAADVDAEAVLARMTGEHPTTSTTTVAGLPATVVDVVSDGSGLLPADYTYRMYVVDTGPRALLLTGAAAPPGSAVDASRTDVDRIASMIGR